MRKTFTLLTCLLFFISSEIFANQKDSTKVDSLDLPPVDAGYFTLGISAGMGNFNGDFNARQNLANLNNFRLTIGGSLEKRFGKLLGVSLNGSVGKLAQNQKNQANNYNFETKFQQFGASLIANFDWKPETIIAPYVSVGFNYIQFSVSSDLKDKLGRPYFYWSDGTIRDKPQKDPNLNIIEYSVPPERLQRDYTYESKVNQTFDGSATKNYKTNAFVIPVTVGFKFKLFEYFETRLCASYNFLTTDYIDNYYNNKNDGYFSTAISAHYTIGKRYVPKAERPYEDVDFSSYAKADADGDGVRDLDDQCAHTPKAVAVDGKGCPLDDDKDGVPNYLDKELNSASGATVNRDGITLTEAELKKLYELRESTYMEKISKFYELPSAEMLQEIAKDLNKVVDESPENSGTTETTPNNKVDEQSGKVLVLPIPEKVKFADQNGDGKLQSSEITNSIDDFLDGKVNTNVNDIMEMIEYFFGQ